MTKPITEYIADCVKRKAWDELYDLQAEITGAMLAIYNSLPIEGQGSVDIQMAHSLEFDNKVQISKEEYARFIPSKSP